MKYLPVLPGLALLFLGLACHAPQKVIIAEKTAVPVPVSSSPSNAPTSSAATASPVVYSEVFKITYASCLPCHNRKTLPQVIERLKTAKVSTIDGEDRMRVLRELEGLQELLDSGSALGFSSGEKELMDLFESVPGGLFTMLEKGVMPPPWAPALMDAIDWPNYARLTIDNRIKLLQFAKPYSEKYIP